MKGTIIKSKKIKSFEEYKNYLTEFSLDEYIFRGQENIKWELESSWIRLINERKKKNLVFPNEENLILKFQKTGLYQKYKNEIQCAWDVLAIMQHFGIPTRLIDFTTDPFIAAYFAVTENSYFDELFRSNVFIINKKLLNEERPQTQIEDLFKFSQPRNSDYSYPLYRYESPLSVGRIQNQKSLFIFMHNPYLSMEEIISIVNNRNIISKEKGIYDLDEQFSRSSEIYKIEIELNTSNFIDFLTKLKSEKGISHDYIFPDPTGEIFEISKSLT